MTRGDFAQNTSTARDDIPVFSAAVLRLP
jgi:hypothetical protein